MKALEVAASWAFFLLLGQGPVIIGFDGCFLSIYLQKSGYTYMITYKQLTLAEIFEDCQNKFDNDK